MTVGGTGAQWEVAEEGASEVRKMSAEVATKRFFDRAPQIPSHSWSAKNASALTALDMVEMLHFCEWDGQGKGYEAALNRRINALAENPFHPEFLGGYPYREWATSYDQGVEEYESLQYSEL